MDTEEYEMRLLQALESIAFSLKIIADRPRLVHYTMQPPECTTGWDAK